MIVIEKDNRMVTIFKVSQIDVDGSSMIRAPKKQKREVTIEGKKEKTIENLIMKKYPKGLDETECKHVDE
jgi:AICAR transformylase/IMP cyclohydrolase PurH